MVNIDKYEQDFIRDYESGDFERNLTVYRKKKILQILKKYNTDRVLEVGCGMEPLFLIYDDYREMCVVEAGRRMADHALELAGNRDHITVIHGFLEEKAKCLKKKEFDFILLVGLIHEVDDADLLIEWIYEISGRDTKILVTTNNPDSFHLTLAYESGLIPGLGILTEKAKQFQRNRVFSMKEMKEFVEEHHFKILEEGGYYIKPFSHHQMKQMLELGIIDENLLDGLDKMEAYMPKLAAENYVVISKQ